MGTTKSRLDLHEDLCKALGSRNVYFQPPEGLKMNYPAIVYSRDDFDDRHANNGAYTHFTAYMVTLIDRDPDSEVLDKLLALPYCRFDRHYASENLNHDTFVIYI